MSTRSRPARPRPPRQKKEDIRQFPFKNVAQAAGLLLLAAISSRASQLNLSPVYGSIPSFFYHQRAITFTALVTFLSKDLLSKYLPSNPKSLIPVLAYWIPTIQLLLCRYSAQMGPVYGPVITEALTYFPLLLLTCFSSVKLLESIDLSTYPPLLADVGPPMVSYITFSFAEKASGFFLPGLVGINPLFTRVAMQLAVASAYAALAPSPLIALAVPAIVHTAWQNPHLDSEHASALLNETLHTHDFSLLERRESLTGYISVLESFENQFVVMRCDHSLLGGEWLITPSRQAQGQVMREPIYGIFSMLDAVRLVQTGDPRSDDQKSALVIGLGIGTSPKSLIAHGINTTIVELDPVVHRFAMKYFELPNEHTAVIQNAVPFVAEQSVVNPSRYDFIIHDVFTGGAEPPALFTREFMTGLRDLLSDKGVIAINYAGDLALPSTNLVLNTIHSVFPTCRLFRDSPPGEQPSAADFVNMVVFCRKTSPSSEGKGSRGIVFKEPDDSDFGRSISKKQFLPPNPDHEIAFEWPADEGAQRARKVLRREDTRELEVQHTESVLSHWRIMRTVLPDVVWELW